MNYIFGGDGGLEPPFATIRTVSSSCRRASNYTSLLWVVIWMMKINHLFGFFRTFPCSPDCNVLGSACTDNSSFLCSPSAYLMQISWISYVVRPFAGSRHPLMLSSYFFSTHTISVHHVKEQFFHVRSLKLSSDARLSLPERPTL